MIIFEYDSVKSQKNLEKHGIDFHDAQALWDDPDLLGLNAKSELESELRFFAIGKIGQKHWTAVYTYRDEAVRIISVRRARKKEIQYYEG
ncbi:MAG: BrnT family toxin [Thiotrichales bacterium]|jgi:hypothetical protein|nr:BrnT family toxin [Thiotrichales bacterium]MBT3614050.1 BrnT family toxin [Thiotrichales bacterium]MBT3753280.1 BrnT family toxin [Thiotrichales bacterium]MBT3836737.1 BrnT family toxin [Thiotrichales bacterium]MBT4151489.1 BrnT family toxin [Thiotrichales bacterium]